MRVCVWVTLFHLSTSLNLDFVFWEREWDFESKEIQLSERLWGNQKTIVRRPHGFRLLDREGPFVFSWFSASLYFVFLDAPSISIRGCVRQSVRKSVRNAFSQTRARRILRRVFGFVYDIVTGHHFLTLLNGFHLLRTHLISSNHLGIPHCLRVPTSQLPSSWSFCITFQFQHHVSR